MTIPSLTADAWSARPVSRRVILATGLAGATGLAAACSPSRRQPAAVPSPARSVPNPVPTVPNPVPTSTNPVPTSTTMVPNPATVGANELGVVPVLMHHRVVETVDSEYDMTPAYFQAELERLHDEGYYPVRTIDVVTGQLGHVPAGRTPVVLTFDDGTPGQFGYTTSGAVNLESGVGILLAFTAAHPGFPATASLYVNRRPFGTTTSAQTARVLSDLVGRGFEIGNHTFDHASLRQLPDQGVQGELARLAEMVTTAVPGVTPQTMSLPFGVEPRVHALAHSGTSGGISYLNEGVVLVGAGPSHSPYHRAFRAQAIPRIRSSSYLGGAGRLLATYWLDHLAAHPAQRYRSAGNPGHVTIPRALLADLNPAFGGQAITY